MICILKVILYIAFPKIHKILWKVYVLIGIIPHNSTYFYPFSLKLTYHTLTLWCTKVWKSNNDDVGLSHSLGIPKYRMR